MTIKYLIVASLAWACGVVDWIPWFHEGRFYRHGQLGCSPLGLASKSARLDLKWHTGYWKDKT